MEYKESKPQVFQSCTVGQMGSCWCMFFASLLQLGNVTIMVDRLAANYFLNIVLGYFHLPSRLAISRAWKLLHRRTRRYRAQLFNPNGGVVQQLVNGDPLEGFLHTRCVLAKTMSLEPNPYKIYSHWNTPVVLTKYCILSSYPRWVGFPPVG